MTIKERFSEIFHYQSSNFEEWFGSMEYVNEKHNLLSKILVKSMNDEEILNELKPEPVSLGDVFNFCKTMNKEIGAIFYCKDKTGVLRAVYVTWHDGGWRVIVYSLEYPSRWVVGSSVFSRNFGSSDTTPLEASYVPSLEERVKALEDKLQKIKELI